MIWLEVKFVKRQEGPEKALKVSKRGDDLNIWQFCGSALARALARVNKLIIKELKLYAMITKRGATAL